MQAQLHRIFSFGTLAIKFDQNVQYGKKLDDVLIVSNGQFDIPLKVISANISPTYPDILNIEVSKMFSYVAEYKYTPKQIHALNTHVLNSKNMLFDEIQLPFDEKVTAYQLFWDTSMYHEMNDLDGEEFLYE
ncbi:hypothetical protein [Kurthia sibirica]|uniref:Uncharacterized protein n=1 Tax=Kurthia sibirica TaxID=202750 RepID=A0A2U3AM47_9BACL|nr:hypothetical protein [Kurthia sibirica]PWI25584.1 hypothetical protein DEX24_08230 [Kurthia sibirica]GEK35367.1 hypothetical protein KSI01_29000 [Kurthia sibirica]